MSPISHGQLLAATLAGAWRDVPPRALISADELEKVTPLLIGSGAAPLAWWKIRRTELASTRAAGELQQSYRYRTLRSAIQEREIETVFARLGSAGVDALLVKGWASARAYPGQGLRPFGDVDVWVRPKRLEEARRALNVPELAHVDVDLHEHFDYSDRRDFDTFYARGESVLIGAAVVRVLAPEDHLRLQCVHLLRHGAWRPLWLCDVAAAIESRGGAGFEWSRITEGDRGRARWVACCVGLAHRLLGANVSDTPFESESSRLPRWLVSEVLKQWETPYPALQAPMRYRAPMRNYLRSPRGLWRDLLNRWPNPIEATVCAGAQFNRLPRWPFQLANCFARAAHFVAGSNET